MHHSQWKEPYCPILAECKEVYWNCGKLDWKLWAIECHFIITRCSWLWCQ
ncbi:hypothetical protein Glove_219g148 [Diversispora epigaea]|uniref:Uncharacterized protein n=1 Tax=Diversispora epigaea TaxID=1348612 RepID=A0A397IG00_9GLOM|nr:hypothetical protein Glove_219g148 [Diversispora epigaea]